MKQEKPLHHQPQAIGAHLLDGAVDGWTLLFEEGMRLAALARQRRAARQAQTEETNETTFAPAKKRA